MRQQGESQKRFKECLNNLADGSFDQEDWKYLKERDLFLGNFTTEERRDIMSSATMITSTNKAAKEYNIKRIKDLGTTIFPVRSENNCKEAANASFSKSGLMSQILFILVGRCPQGQLIFQISGKIFEFDLNLILSLF